MRLDLGFDESDRVLVRYSHLELGSGQRLDDDIELCGPHNLWETEIERERIGRAII